MSLNLEPVAIAAALRAIILCAVAFGLRWTPEQIAALMLAVEAILAVLVRQNVTPTAAPTLPSGTLVKNPAAPDGDVPPPDLVVAPR